MAELPAFLLIALLCAAVYSSYRHAILPFPLTLGGSLIGTICAVLLPQSLGEKTPTAALVDSVSGFFTGFLIAWLALQLGKAIFGKVIRHFDPAVYWHVMQTDGSQPPFICLGEEVYGWADVFARTSDRLRIDCNVLNVGPLSYENVTADLMAETLTIGGPAGQTLRLENVTHLNGLASKVVIPREALGFGVVLLSAMIGSFVGSLPAVYIFGSSLLLLFLVTGLYSLGTRTRWSAKIEVAPYALLTCLLYLVLRHCQVL